MKLRLLAALLFMACALHAQVETDVEEVMIEDRTPVDGVVIFQEKSKYGIRSYLDGSTILPAQYTGIYEGVSFNYIVDNNGAKGVFNTVRKKFVLPAQYEDVRFSRVRGSYSNVDTSGFVVIVKRGGKFGLTDHRYRFLLEPEYDEIAPSGRFVQLKRNQQYGIWFFNRNQHDIPLDYTMISQRGSYFIATGSAGADLYTRSGRLVSEHNKSITVFFDRWTGFSENNCLVVAPNGKKGIYSGRDSTFIVPVMYDSIADVFRDNFIVRQKSKFGVVTKGNQVMIPFKYKSLRFLQPRTLNTLLLASKGKQFALINLKNKAVTEYAFDDGESINQYYKLSKGNRYFAFDSLGRQLSTRSFTDIGFVHYGRCAVFEGTNVGYMSVAGEILEEPTRPSGARGFRKPEDAFEAFAAAIRADNDEALLAFAQDINVDDYSLEFFNRIHYQYRGIPTEMQKRNISPNQLADLYFKQLKQFADRLKTRGEKLSTFTFIGLEQSGLGYVDYQKNIMGTEVPGLFTTDKGKYRCKLGELISVDGWFKTFTEFRRL